MRKGLCFVLALLGILSLTGCVGASSGRHGGKAGSEKIVFPSSLERVEGIQDEHADLSSPVPRLVVYVDSTECSNCRINHLGNYSEYASLSALYPGFKVFAIIWPNSETAETVTGNIAHRNFPFDVFIDWDGSFLEANPSLPKTGRDSHVFLLGTDSKAVVSGDPISSKGKDRMLRNALYSIYNDK